jgi:hypothetical protein
MKAFETARLSVKLLSGPYVDIINEIAQVENLVTLSLL